MAPSFPGFQGPVQAVALERLGSDPLRRMFYLERTRNPAFCAAGPDGAERHSLEKIEETRMPSARVDPESSLR
jgi:hypothetical protein